VPVVPKVLFRGATAVPAAGLEPKDGDEEGGSDEVPNKGVR
jgi:hypothetical protein